MFQNRHKLQCEDKKGNNDKEEPKRDIELCLEVEMDDEVRELITSPEKCASTLLDVTVIKPKDIDQIYTAHKKTLNGEEVRKLIHSMELEKDDQKKIINKILCKDDTVVTIHRHANLCKSGGDYSKNKKKEQDKRSPNRPVRCLNSQESLSLFEQLQKHSTTDETNSDLSNYNKTTYKNMKSAGDHERVEQIYTSPRTYNDLKALFTCKNKNKLGENEKPTKPCLCQNCAILGLLNDAQKRPFVTEHSYDPREQKKGTCCDKPKRRKSVNFKEEVHTECEYYFKYLSSKIKTLEERLALQEEKSVSRDYFKKIITKLVNHISKLTNHGAPPDSRSQKNRDTHKYREKVYDNLGHRYYVHPVLIDQSFKHPPGRRSSRSNISTPPIAGSGISPAVHSAVHSPSFWKWGEEILKPGIDLKNKIIDLLEETLQNLRRPRENVSRADGNIKNFVDDFSTKLYKTINEIPVRDVPSKKKENIDQSKCSSDPTHSNSGSSLSKKLDHALKSGEKKVRKMPTRSVKKDTLFEEPLNVSYFNPKIGGWHEESQISFKFESSDIDSAKPTEEKTLNDSYKQEFMETISNTKEADKLKLWQSVWSQAKTNGQSKQDKVTIQIPNRKDLKKHKMIEIEYTIAELEALLTGKKSSVAQKSEKKDVNYKKGERK